MIGCFPLEAVFGIRRHSFLIGTNSVSALVMFVPASAQPGRTLESSI